MANRDDIFHIRRMQVGDFALVVFSTSYLGLFDWRDDIAAALAAAGYKGDVLFDLLASNGDASNRFIKLHFDGQSFDRASIGIATLTSEQSELCDEVYRANPAFLENAIYSASRMWRD